MPYVIELDRIRMARESMPEPKTVGDLNYLITLDILEAFLTEPRYHTIHKIWKKHFLMPQQTAPKWWTEKKSTNFDDLDFVTASQLASLEFYDRIGRKYEDLAIQTNGDLDAYKEVIKLLNEKEAELHANRS